jgi:hypothetical protein
VLLSLDVCGRITVRKLAVRIVLAVVALALLVGGYMVFRIGPQNVWGMMRYDQRRDGDLQVGHRAPDVALTALDGSRVQLGDRIGGRPLVLVFGSYT